MFSVLSSRMKKSSPFISEHCTGVILFTSWIFLIKESALLAGSFYKSKCPYVALSDPGSMKFSHNIEHSPRDWETTVCQNVSLTVFHTQNICHHAWKTHRTKLFRDSESLGKSNKKKWSQIWKLLLIKGVKSLRQK